MYMRACRCVHTTMSTHIDKHTCRCVETHTHTHRLCLGPKLQPQGLRCGSGERSCFMPACLLAPHPVARSFLGGPRHSWPPDRLTDICLGLSDISTKSPVSWETPESQTNLCWSPCPRPQAGPACPLPLQVLLCHLCAGQGPL